MIEQYLSLTSVAITAIMWLLHYYFLQKKINKLTPRFIIKFSGVNFYQNYTGQTMAIQQIKQATVGEKITLTIASEVDAKGVNVSPIQPASSFTSSDTTIITDFVSADGGITWTATPVKAGNVTITTVIGAVALTNSISIVDPIPVVADATITVS